TETVAVASGISINSRKEERLAIFICRLRWKIIVHSTVPILRTLTCRMHAPAGHLCASGTIMSSHGQVTKVSMLQVEAITLLHKTRKFLPTRHGGNLFLRM